MFDTPANVYLGLKQANSSLQNAHSDADLIDVAALLWAMAQQIEDGDASQAERDLRAAEQALREALQRGASDEEIRKLMKELREAAKRFMSEMARNAEPNASPDDQNLQAQDLDKLLDRMEDTARNGAREDAQAMLDQMQEMFENMRSAREGEESPAEREMRKQIGELEKLLRDQQALRDDTFRSDQRDRARKRARNKSRRAQGRTQAQPDEGEPPAGPDQGDEADPSAKPGQDEAGQAAARPAPERAARPARRIAAQAQELGDEGREGLRRRARRYERGGRRPLGRSGQSPTRAGSPARALRSTRKAARSKRCAKARRDCRSRCSKDKGKGSNGKGGYVARRTRPGELPGDDPLGRGAQGDKGRDDGPLKGSVGAAERARRVMEELRRRLADPDPRGRRTRLSRAADEARLTTEARVR